MYQGSHAPGLPATGMLVAGAGGAAAAHANHWSQLVIASVAVGAALIVGGLLLAYHRHLIRLRALIRHAPYQLGTKVA